VRYGNRGQIADQYKLLTEKERASFPYWEFEFGISPLAFSIDYHLAYKGV